MKLTGAEKDAVVEAAEHYREAINSGMTLAETDRRGEKLDAALNPSPLPSHAGIIHRLAVGLHRLKSDITTRDSAAYEVGHADGLRLASVRFGHQEGCGEGCAYCDVTRWADEMEKR